jgi:hydroxymethylglutaryl-CoA lyase
VLAALDADVREFDASLGGLGGCPYAPGASGNICTEDLVFMLEAMGLRTGIDIEKLIAVRAEVQQALEGQPFHGTIAKAGLPKGFQRAA